MDHQTMAKASRGGDVETAMKCAGDHMNITMTAAKGMLGAKAIPHKALRWSYDQIDWSAASTDGGDSYPESE